MPGRAVASQVPAPAAPQDARPSWLVVPTPDTHAATAPHTPVVTQAAFTAPATDQVVIPPDETPPLWAQPAKPSSIRTVSMVGAGVALALMVGWAGMTAWQQNALNLGASTNSAVSVAQGETAKRLSAKLDGQHCPVVHPGDTGCWKGSLVNTGPAIGKLAITFVSGSPYTDWFGHHTNAMLSGFYTTPGCELDSSHLRIVCGPVAPNATVSVYLIGDVSTAGTFHYAVKFADISSGSSVYVNQRTDGSPEIVSWIESAS